MRKIFGLALIALGVFLEFLWLSFCFGSIIIGVILLIFAPRILFFPFNFFLILGLSTINPVKYNRSSGFQYQRGRSQYNNSYGQQTTNINTHYETLESKQTDSLDVIKANYRRLIKEYHYDTLASQNLSDEMIKLAEKKTQELNEAYAVIKKEKK